MHRFLSVLCTMISLIVLLHPSRACGQLFVSSHDTHEVYRYGETNGSFVDVFVTSGSGGLNNPHAVTFGPDRNLYVASSTTDEILRYNGTNGVFMNAFVTSGSGGLDYPAGMMFGIDGHLYVASQNNDRILRFHGNSGAFIDTFVTAGSGGLNGPSVLTYGPDTNLYVTGRYDNQVYRYHAFNGSFIDVFVTNALSQPFGCAFGADGNLYVSSGNDGQIKRFNGDTGAYIDDFATGLSLPVEFIIGPDNHFYVCSYGSDRIERYDRITGAFMGSFVTTGSGGLDGPNFLTFRPAGSGSLDRDSDGMPDAWEIEHTDAGHYAGITHPVLADFDHDGQIDLDEYLADTDPDDSNSFLAVVSATRSLAGVEIGWKGGSNAVQVLERSEELDGSTTGWTGIFTNQPPTAQTNSAADLTVGTNTAAFYRLRGSRP